MKIVFKYSPDQPRNANGEWTDTGGGMSMSNAKISGDAGNPMPEMGSGKFRRPAEDVKAEEAKYGASVTAWKKASQVTWTDSDNNTRTANVKFISNTRANISFPRLKGKALTSAEAEDKVTAHMKKYNLPGEIVASAMGDKSNNYATEVDVSWFNSK